MTGFQYARCADCRKKEKIEVGEMRGIRYGRQVDTQEPWIFVQAENNRRLEPHGWFCDECGPEVAELV